MKVLLATLNAKYIHVNLALRWLFVSSDKQCDTLIKEYVIKDDLHDIVKDIVAINPDVLGLSCYIWNIEQMKELIPLVHDALPNIRIILGGPEVSFESSYLLDLPIEAIIRGEGEKAFWQAVRKEKDIDGYLSKTYVSSVPYAKVDISWLETLESPYFLDFDLKDMHNRYFYIETSRGCPYRCSYCLSSVDNQVRLFSLDYIEKQLKMLETHPVKQIKFLDRTFNVYPERAKKLANFIKDLKVDTTFQFEIVADSIDQELLAIFLKNPEKYRFEIGVQSFNPQTIQAVDRVQDFTKLKENVLKMKKQGCIMHLDLIAGLPYEDYASFKDSFNKLFSLQAGEIQVGILKMLKGTKLKSQDHEYGFEYNEVAPFDIEKTNWLTREELNNVNALYHATEKLLNNNRARKTLEVLFEYHYDVFDILVEVGKMIEQDNHLQNKSLFLALYQVVLNKDSDKPLDDTTLKALLQDNYYRLFKQRTNRLFVETKIDKDIQKAIFKTLIDKGYDEHLLYNYGNIEYGFDKKQKLMLIIYSNNQQLPSVEYIEGEINGNIYCN